MLWAVSESDLYLRPIVDVPIKEILSIYLQYQTNPIIQEIVNLWYPSELLGYSIKTF